MLLHIDSATDKLYLQSPLNNSILVEIGILGVNVEGANSFDISGTKGVAYAQLISGSSTKLYSINISTGAASVV